VVRTVQEAELPPPLARRLLALADALLRAPAMRLRMIPPERILSGLVARHLAGPLRDAV
jgi:hypothetical protein